MSPSSRLAPEAAVVRKLNLVFYDAEASRYDERHPEVVEGDADWWVSRGQKLIAELKSSLRVGAGLRILDVGCGTGFVSSLLATRLTAGDLIIGVDQSEGMLRRAEAKFAAMKAGQGRFVRGDAASLQFRDQCFEMLTVNSFLHHVYDYRGVLREIDRVLKPGGYLLLAHEPNREFFQSSLTRMAAAAYKLIGFGMKVPKDLRDEINARLRDSELVTSEVGSDDILRLVEYHSPVEQGSVRIDPTKGFSLPELLAGELRNYAVIEREEYSTFFHRPLLERNPSMMRAAKAAGGLFGGAGNLFRAVLRKSAP